MRRALLLLVLLATVAMAQTPALKVIAENSGPVTNLPVEGALAPTNPIECIALEEVPRYMVLHGMRAVTGDSATGALRPDFDPARVGATLQAQYLHCTA